MSIHQQLAAQIAQLRSHTGRPIIQGILGGQGTGKTTLALSLISILEQMGYSTVTLSLDDLYKTYDARLALQQQDPRLIWRGPPGTHDVDLGLNVLEAVRNAISPISIPRFDKSIHSGAGDRTTPDTYINIDILLFEGWFVGARPIDPVKFEAPVPPIINAADKAFARDMNQELANYLPLWQRLDSLIVLYPQDYRYSVQWRKEAEHKMIASGRPGMTDIQIEEFVNYFWRALHPELFIKALITSPQYVDSVIEIDANHNFVKLYHPSTP
ncbi:MAG: glycerate kinase [Calothrix sp. FI2-JRJ7]|jgi:D-glycerate 3-kinase|nr:glycerate kinase [Calothrix sp. FI2-JRJ7]